MTGSGNLCQTARLAIGKERQEERETLTFLLSTELGKSRWRKEVYVESLCRKLQKCRFVWKDGVFYCGNGTFAKSFIESKVSFEIILILSQAVASLSKNIQLSKVSQELKQQLYLSFLIMLIFCDLINILELQNS